VEQNEPISPQRNGVTKRARRVPITLTINGEIYDLDVAPGQLLVDTLRYELGLTGTKEGCGVGVCGACTVLLNGLMVSSCLTLSVEADGASITTIEGLVHSTEELTPLQQAFADRGAVQCGFCTPGQLVAATGLLDNNPRPTEEDVKEWLMGNLCRCTGYYKIVEAVLAAAEESSAAAGGARVDG
jgi:carbon-monoxide dehydrogenase small subunit